MAADTLNLNGAAGHFLRTKGPGGFLLKFALTYAAVAFVVQLISLWLSAPVYEVYLRAFTENDGDITPYLDEINAASMRTNLGTLVLLPLGLLIWVVFEAASQRRYLRDEGFRLAIGADEGRLAVVGLIWFALSIGGYIALVIVAMVPGVIAGLAGGPAAGAVVGGIALLAGLVAGLWFFARLSPAGSLTIRDRQIRFFEAWSLTRGHGWSLARSYLLLFAVFTVILLIAYGVLGLIAFALILPATQGGEADAETIISAMSQPGFWAPVAVLTFLLMILSSGFAHVVGGPAALAARQGGEAAGAALPETFS